MSDYYSLLGVSRGCSDAELKKAYRSMAKKYHPDVNKEKNAEEKFKEIQSAYDVLKDPEKRKMYDNYGKDWDKAGKGGFGGFGGASGASGFQFDDLGDIFGDLFGSGRSSSGFSQGSFSQQRAQKGEDIEVTLKLSAEQALEGGKRKVTYNYKDEISQSSIPQLKQASVELNIPKSVANGKKLRVKGRGGKGVGHNAPSGDLYIKVEVISTKEYKVENNDVLQHVNITPWEAVFGASLEIKTPYGLKKVKVPEATQSGKKVRIKGKGLNGADFYIVYDVKLPEADTQEKIDLYNQMKDAMDFNPRD